MKNLQFTFSLLFLSHLGIAQETNLQIHKEVQNDSYIKVNRASMKTSPAYMSNLKGVMTRQVNVDANGNNIVGDAANEPSIAINPNNPNSIVLGWRQFDTVDSDFRQAGYGYSTDGGETWTFPGSLEPGVFRSDPVLDFDANGNFYYNSLNADTNPPSNFNCSVFKSENGGVDWSSPIPARGGDKGWMEVDKTSSEGSGNIYSYWNLFFSECENLNFTRSTDNGVSFEACSLIPNAPLYGTLAVDLEGNLYQTGFQVPGVFVQKSTNAKDASQNVTWGDYVVVPLGGGLPGGGNANPGGLSGHTWIEVDKSNSATSGYIYVLSTIPNYNSSGDPVDIVFSRSIDGGTTFSEGIKINTDPGNTAEQWFGTLSVAPNGRIDVVWLDTRDAPVGTYESALYYCFSEDGGETWSPNTPISEAFDPQIGYPGGDQKLGDYFDMVSDNNYAHLAWANTFTGGQDVYYSRITPELTLSILENELADNSLIVTPNPVTTETAIQFNLTTSQTATLELFNISGKKITAFIDRNIQQANSISWNEFIADQPNLKSGIYFLRLTTEESVLTRKVIVK